MFLVEPIERRCLLAASISMVGNTLLARCAEQVPSTVVVAANSDNVHLDVTITSTPGVGSPVVVSQQFNVADVAMVKVRGGHRADTITIGSIDHPVSINTRVNGLGGSDSITTGGGNDRIAGGQGYDTINAGGGNDLVFGQRGNDLIDGGDGNDSLWGGVGEDTLNGGAGADVLGGLLGTNLLTGGADGDTFVVKAGHQSQASDFVDGVDTYKVRGSGSTDGSEPPPTA